MQFECMSSAFCIQIANAVPVRKVFKFILDFKSEQTEQKQRRRKLCFKPHCFIIVIHTFSFFSFFSLLSFFAKLYFARHDMLV